MLHVAYGCYALAVAAVGALFIVVPLAPLPSLRARWRITRAVRRAVLRSTGLMPRVGGIAHLPGRGPAVLMANHASCLDARRLTPDTSPDRFAAALALRERVRRRLLEATAEPDLG